MSNISEYLNSSIGRKQIVATTGLLLILFVIGHLAGNLLIYLGPDAFNGYAKKLEHLRPGLYFIETGLLFIFVIHMYFTALLVLENIQARSVNYAQYRPRGQRSLATRLMSVSGVFILCFIIWHLMDFTFADKTGPRSVLADGKSYALYGVVYNSFTDPIHGLLYIIAMMCLGLHLSHGVQSFAQTFGFSSPQYTPAIKKISNWFALVMALGYSSIPIYIFLQTIKH